MPRWSYECPECSYEVEKVFPNWEASEAWKEFCPICRNADDGYTGLVRLVKVPSAGSFILKGVGFYKNDYGKHTKQL